MGQLKKSSNNQWSQEPDQTFFNTQSDIDYEEKIEEMLSIDEIKRSLKEFQTLKQQQVSIDFQTKDELWTLSGYLLGTDHPHKLAKLAPALLNHKQIYKNLMVDMWFIKKIIHLQGPKYTDNMLQILQPIQSQNSLNIEDPLPTTRSTSKPPMRPQQSKTAWNSRKKNYSKTKQTNGQPYYPKRQPMHSKRSNQTIQISPKVSATHWKSQNPNYQRGSYKNHLWRPLKTWISRIIMEQHFLCQSF